MTRICALRKERSLIKNMAIAISQLIPNSILNNHKLIQGLDNLCKSRDYESSVYVGNLVGNWGMKEIMPRTFIGKPVLYPFEDTEVYGPEDYEKYLTCVYGDWRKMPPLEKQKSHHDYLYINLHKSFKE